MRAVEYRTVYGKDPDDLTTRLNEESKGGQWKVVGIVKDGHAYRAFLEGTAYPVPVPPEPEKTELERLREKELREASESRWDEAR